MELPILHKLKDGEKFDFATLAKNVEQADDFLAWWWEEKAQAGKISWPEVIVDDDPILVPTVEKATVDLKSHLEFFDRPLLRLIKLGILPAVQNVPRDAFRAFAIRFMAENNSLKRPGRPQIVFTGGGHGSGKTTVINFLAKEGMLPVELAHLAGVDVFMPLIPEYNLVKAVADGRASFTVQKECKELASELFDTLIHEKRSFVWETSMSSKEDTLNRIKIATESGYKLTMIAILTPLPQAIKQAMHRAKLSRRFPHPEALPKSHTGFRKTFSDYISYFDEIKIFANDSKLGDTPLLIGTKSGKENALGQAAGGLLDCALRLEDAE